MQSGPVWPKTDFECSESFHGVARLGLGLRGWLRGKNGQFHCPDEFLTIVLMNSAGRVGIVAAQVTVKKAWRSQFLFAKAAAQSRVAGGSGRKSFKERPQIEARPSYHDGDVVTVAYAHSRLPREFPVIRGREFLVGIDQINKMMRCLAEFLDGWFCGADVHSAIHLDGIATDDLALKFQRERQCKLSFAGARWPEYHDKGPRIAMEGSAHSAIYLLLATVIRSRTSRSPIPFMSSRSVTTLRAACALFAVLAGLPAVSVIARAQAQSTTAATTKPQDSKASAYYHYSLGHLYEELAATYGNRSDYVNSAIENYQLAMKEDPSATFLIEDIAELYRVSGRIREAVEEAQRALKANPDDLNARRVLARIYTQEIGDAQTNHVDEGMARRAIEQFKIIADKDPKDLDSVIMLGRLDKLVGDSVDAEGAFKKALAADPGNEDATVGLADIYSDRGDAQAASQLLEKLAATNASPRALVILANDYEQLHDYARAADTYKKALALDPGRSELKGALAQDQALAGNFADALETYKQLADDNPQDAQPYLGMSQIYREQKKFDLAGQMNAKARSLEPDNLEAQFEDVLLLEDEGKTNDAIARLKSMLDTTARRTYNANERNSRARLLEKLGLLYRKDEQYEQSVDAFRQIAALDTGLAPRAEAQIIDTYRIAKEYPKARQENDEASKKYPTDRTLREVRAQLFADEGKTDAAVGELQQLLDGKNDREVYLAMAEAYERNRQWTPMSKALDEADKLSKGKDERAAILFMRGSMFERQKQFDQAEQQFRQVLTIDPPTDPTYAETLNYYGYMLADRDTRLQEAQDLIQRALTIDPNNYAFLDSMGWVYYRLNRLDEAERQLSRSVQLMSKDPTIHDHLGDVYFKQGKIKEAINQWQFSLTEWGAGASSDEDPDELAKVQKKLDSARLRLAKEQNPDRSN